MSKKTVTLISTEMVQTAHGLRCLSTLLRNQGHKTRIVFCGTLERHYTKGQLKALTELVSDSDLIGVSCYSQSSHYAAELTENLRKTGIPVVWGGCHATLCPEDSLRHSDMVCLGEGEGPLLDLVESLDDKAARKSIPNLWTKDSDGTIHKNPLRPLISDADTLPLEDFDFQTQYFLDPRSGTFKRCSGEDIGAVSYRDVIKKRSLKGFSVSLSRGCKFACGYCFCHDFKLLYRGDGNSGVRRKTPRAAINEILHYIRILGLTPKTHFLSFDDEDFFAQPLESLREFCELYRKEIGIAFGAHVHVHSFSEEKMDILVKAGLRVVTVGLQTGSDRINREIYKRGVNNSEVLAAAAILQKYRKFLFIPPSYHVISANPYETEEDVWQTINLIRALPTPFNIQIFQLSFFPNSWLAKKALADGIFQDEKELAYEEHYYDAISYAWRRKTYRYAWFLLHLLVGTHARRMGMVPAWLFSLLTTPSVRNFFEHRPGIVRLLTPLLFIEYRYRRFLPFMRKHFYLYRES